MPSRIPPTTRKTSARSKRPRFRKGIRGELLPGDGKTFTVLTTIPRGPANVSRTYHMTQEYSLTNVLTSSTTINVFASFTTNFGNQDQYAALTSIFDQYRIKSVEMWLIPQFSAASSVNLASGLLATVIDLDDASSLTFNQCGDYTSCITTAADQGHYRRFIPHCANSLYSGAFTAFGNVPAPWIDTASPSVIHYGMKAVVSVMVSSASYDLRVRHHLELRSVR